jgi:hypothetical protein
MVDSRTEVTTDAATDEATTDRDYRMVEGRTVEASMPPWSPAQIIGLIVGIGFAALGIAAIARTGFHTDHIYTPHADVWNLPHSPLLGLIEIGFGVLMVIASVVPGGARGFMGFLGAISVGFGIVVLVEQQPNRLNDWLAVTHRSGWLYLVVGVVVLLSAILSPVFGGELRRRTVRRKQVVA